MLLDTATRSSSTWRGQRKKKRSSRLSTPELKPLRTGGRIEFQMEGDPRRSVMWRAAVVLALYSNTAVYYTGRAQQPQLFWLPSATACTVINWLTQLFAPSRSHWRNFSSSFSLSLPTNRWWRTCQIVCSLPLLLRGGVWSNLLWFPFVFFSPPLSQPQNGPAWWGKRKRRNKQDELVHFVP